MLAKQFFCVCAGILCLALAYHLGAVSATAQAGSTVSGFAVQYATIQSSAYFAVMTPNGDIYGRGLSVEGADGILEYFGNFWSGAPTPATQETWGGVKARYRPAAPQEK